MEVHLHTILTATSTGERYALVPAVLTRVLTKQQTGFGPRASLHEQEELKPLTPYGN
jgi:hypothetical protein